MNNNFKELLKVLGFITAIVAIGIYLSSLGEQSSAIIIMALLWYTIYLTRKILKKVEKSAEYLCLIKKEIHTALPRDEWDLTLIMRDGKEATLKQRIELPFVPYPGLDLYPGKLEKVRWRGGAFECYVTPHQMSETNILGAVLEHHLEEGDWQLESGNSRAENALVEWKETQKNEKAENPDSDRQP